MNYDPINKIALIDQFAMAALTGILTNSIITTSDRMMYLEGIANDSYAMAEEMMKIRMKRTQSKYAKQKYLCLTILTLAYQCFLEYGIKL